MQKPTIVIVAGGRNSRFFPLNTQTHKGFLPIMGKPIVIRALEDLEKHEFKEVIIIVSKKDYENKGFSQYLEETNLGLNIEVVLQKEPKGMGNALLTAKAQIEKSASDSFILASPYYSRMGQKAQELWDKKQETNANCVLSGTSTEHPELYGILNFDPNDSTKVLGIIEKPQKENIQKQDSSAIKADSLYLFDKEFLNELSATQEVEYALEEAITSYAKKTDITWIENTQVIESLKYPWHLFRRFNQLIKKEESSISKDAEIAKTAILDTTYGPIIIESGAKVGEFTKISGPCYVGKDVLVGDYSFVRSSSLESQSVVGANSEIVRSILFEKSSIHYGYLADSILGSETQVGAGIITANKRFDRKNIKVKVKDKMVDTRLKALGIITGHNTKIGIRVNTMPGTFLGKNSIIYPNLTIDKNVNEDETLKK